MLKGASTIEAHIAREDFKLRTQLLAAVTITLGGCISGQSEARTLDPCDDAEIKNYTLKELIRDADYIALYDVISVEKDDVSSFANTESYTYRLSNARTVKSRAPALIDITGVKPLSTVPQVYFALTDRHADVSDEAPGRLGLSPFIPTTTEGVCKPAAQFMIGYSYLVFGGVDSEIGYEPIHSTKYDPWFLRIMRVVEDEKQQ